MKNLILLIILILLAGCSKHTVPAKPTKGKYSFYTPTRAYGMKKSCKPAHPTYWYHRHTLKSRLPNVPKSVKE